jgi:hypothetical protein
VREDKFDCYVSPENFSSLYSYYQKSDNKLRWEPLFVIPTWLQTWWDELGSEFNLELLAIYKDNRIIGIAPLKVKEKISSIIGSSDVSDYVDFIVLSGQEDIFCSCLLEYLSKKDISYLDLYHVRPESTIFRFLIKEAEKQGCKVSCHQDDVSLELNLPTCWDDYLTYLSGKQRHEIRRKMRRIQEAGSIKYHTINGVDQINNFMPTFFWMFSESRADKKRFLTISRESFFRTMIANMAREGYLKMGLLELNNKPVALVLYFDYNNKIYLYNSGYDPHYKSLSVGLITKLFCIKDSIEKNKVIFDFLKGNEDYKYRLGGKEIPLYRCHITI